MDYLNGATGTIYRITDWIMKFTVVHITWLIFNLPIVYIVISSLFIGETEILGLLILLLAILSPFLFFPSTMALFATVKDWIISEEDHRLLLKVFWGYYQSNYKRSMQAGCIFVILWLIWLADIYFLANVHILFVFLFILIGLFLFVYTINFFSTNVYYESNLRTTLKNALIITITSPMLFIAVMLCHMTILYISLYAFRFLLVFFTMSVIVYVSFGAFNQFHIKNNRSKQFE